MLGEEGAGFAIAQARLGPGRIHHCMRAIGMAERAFDLMCGASGSASPFGKPLAGRASIRDWIAESRIEIEQARLLTLKTAWLMDTAGNKGARIEISAIKVVGARLAVRVIDRAIQVHGGGGRQRRLPARGDVRGRAHAADRRRPRRGAQHGDRPAGAAALRVTGVAPAAGQPEHGGPEGGGDDRRGEYPDLGVVDEGRVVEGETRDEQRHREADAGEHGDARRPGATSRRGQAADPRRTSQTRRSRRRLADDEPDHDADRHAEPASADRLAVECRRRRWPGRRAGR